MAKSKKNFNKIISSIISKIEKMKMKKLNYLQNTYQKVISKVENYLYLGLVIIIA